MTDAVVQFGHISLCSRSGTSEGHLKVTSNGIVWKRSQGGKTIDIPANDIESLTWSKTSRACALGVQRKQDYFLYFVGFRDDDIQSLRQASKQFNLDLKEQALAVSGHNWGNAKIDGGVLVFDIDARPAFRVPLRDVSQVVQSREEVSLEFPADDTAGGDREDALLDMAFYIPRDAQGYAGQEDEAPAKVFYERVMEHTDAEAVGEAVVTFGGVAVLAPRGRFDIEMHLGFLKLVGQAQDYRIQYDSILRLFVLPKSHSPHTLVVISLDPPVRKGQTYYAHILTQFPSEDQSVISLEIDDDTLAAKNAACGGKLPKRELEGAVSKVFAHALRGLSGKKMTTADPKKPGTFKAADGDSPAIRCSYKADDGYLYPLEHTFFYVHKPPTLLPFPEVEHVEFLRQGGGVLAASAKTFDLNIRLKNEQEYLFRGIQKSEWNNLFGFIQAKRLRIENLREAEMGPRGAGGAIDMGDDIDTGIAQLQAKGEVGDLEDSEEDADFEAGSAPSDDDESEATDAEEGPAAPKPRTTGQPKNAAAKEGQPKKRPAPVPKAPKAGGGGEGGAKPKRAKKDKNAPKKGLSAFMFFSNAKRDQVKADNPGIAFGEVGKVLGEMWRQVSAEEKEHFAEMAARDKERYEADMVDYRAKQAGEAAD